MPDSQLKTHQVHVLSGNQCDHHPDQQFAVSLMKILLASGSRLNCIERFMDMMHHTFPDIQLCLFSAHSESRLSLICSRPQVTDVASERFFPVLSAERCCTINDLMSSEVWKVSYADLFPGVSQCLLFRPI